MEKQTNINIDNFANKQILDYKNRMFSNLIVGSSIIYFLTTLWLNSIRTTAPILFVWILIIIQFVLYFSVFIDSYNYSVIYGLNKNTAFFTFFILAFFGRVNDLDMFIIPVLVIITLIHSGLSKNSFNKDSSKVNREKQKQHLKPNKKKDNEIIEGVIGIILGVIVFGGVFILLSQ